MENIKPVEPVFSEEAVAVYALTDNAYAPFLGTAVYSLLQHTDCKFQYDIIIFENHISEGNRKKFIELAEGKSHCSIRLFAMNDLLDTLKVNAADHISKNSYAKIFVMSDWFKRYDKIFLLDSDTLVIDDISTIRQLDFKGYPVAAVKDSYIEILMKRGFHADKRLGFRPLRECYADQKIDIKNYFNAGIMAFDLKRCREEKFFDKTMKLCNENPVVAYMEQDILNMVFKDNWLPLDLKWNGMSPYSIVPQKGDFPEDYEDRIRNGIIIHFLGGNKPWQDKKAFYAEEYMKSAEETPWKEDVINARRAFEERNRTKNIILPKGSKRRDWFYRAKYKVNDFMHGWKT